MGVNIYVVTKNEISPALFLKVLENNGFATVAETNTEGYFFTWVRRSKRFGLI
jgi:hypothetical protein